MEITVMIMQKEYRVDEYSIEISPRETVGNVLIRAQALGWIDSEKRACSVYGERVKPTHHLEAGDRLELCVALPTDPMIRRRNRALRSKNR